MTAEIAILNKSGIVLASDSASTIGNNKVYNSAKKLFTLNPIHSIGIMIYGSAEFMETPWEIIIGQYRKSVEDNVLKTLKDYELSFFNFLREQNYLQTENLQDNYAINYIQSVIQIVFKSIEKDVNAIMAQGQNIDDSVLISLLLDSINEMRSQFSSSYIVEIDKDIFEQKYKEIFSKTLYKISVYDEVSKKIEKELFEFVLYTIERDSSFTGSTGIVIAGYGSEDIFPSLMSYNLYSFILGNLKYSNFREAKISQAENELRSTILPFAQDDVVNTVVQGVDPQLAQYLVDQSKYFDDNNQLTYNDIINTLSKIQREYYINPMLDMIALLPVDETAVIAETLMNLTSFKRKYSNSIETVGGPIDVLAITPSEGPIWIKRKHYFNLADNLGYKMRRNNK